MKKFVSRRRIFSSLDGVWGGEKREERREFFFCLRKHDSFKRREERERDEVVLKKVIFCLFSQNVIVRERNDAFLCLSRETVSVWY